MVPVQSDEEKDQSEDEVVKQSTMAVETVADDKEGVELPFNELDDKTLRQVVSDSAADGPETTRNKGYEQIKKIYRKKILPSGEVQYYLSWSKFPAKKHRCWVKRSDLSPELQEYVDTKKLPCTK